MYKGKYIGVTVPAYNEAKRIQSVIDTMPDYVDRIYVVNDCSTDDTYQIACGIQNENPRLVVIPRHRNGGVGAAVLSGHRVAAKDMMDVMVVMAGDGQMDPSRLHEIIDPVVEGRADYAKGDRLSVPQYRKAMPRWRAFGSFLLTHLTRIASGYHHISDPQNGYTAISAGTLQKLDLDRIERGFAFENDMLVRLNVIGARVVDVPHPAVYQYKQSKIKYHRFILRTSWLLLKDFIWRIWVKYLK